MNAPKRTSDIASRKGIKFWHPTRTGPRIFGIGAAKTGTHTIGKMFEGQVSSAHEKDAERLIRLHLDRVAGGDESKLHKYLRSRDRKRQLKIDASQVNIYLLDDLETLFPDSQYILTVRPPVSWLRSMIDDSLRRDASNTWMEFRNYRFGKAIDHPVNEQALAENGLHTLKGYLSYWQYSVRKAMEKLPPERYLLVSTFDIGKRSNDIAEFCGIQYQQNPSSVSHAFRNPSRFGVLNELDKNYLLNTVEEVVGDTARTIFPEWASESDLTQTNSD